MKKLILIAGIIISCTGFLSAQPSWVKTSTQNIGIVSNIAIIGSDIFISTNKQMYLSTNNGVKWVLLSGFPAIFSIQSLVSVGQNLFVAGGRLNNGGAVVYESSDLGVTWTDVSPPSKFPNDAAITLLIDQDIIYVGTFFSGLYRSGLTGVNSNTWTSFSANLPVDRLGRKYAIGSLNILGSNIIAGTYQGVWISSKNFNEWIPTSGTVSGENYIRCLWSQDSVVLAASSVGSLVLYRSIDSGHNWNPVYSTVFSNWPLEALINNADTIFAGSGTNGVFISTDTGVTWAEYNDGFKDGSGNWIGNAGQHTLNALIINGGKIYAATRDGVWTRSVLVVHPVELVSFDATYKNGSAYLTWKTATESNLKKFEIERSFNGRTFKKIGEVNAVGNSSLIQLYNYADNSIGNYNGNIFFRLKQIDFDGKFSYSPIISIKIKHGIQQAQVYPNPAKEQLTLQISPAQVGLKYHITNAAGQQVLSGNLSALKTTIVIRNIESGTYFLQIEEKDKETIKFLKE